MGLASNHCTSTNLYSRITVLLITAFLVSWGVYAVGLYQLLLTWPAAEPDEQDRQGSDDNEDKNRITLSKMDPSLYSFYVTLIGGPILGLTGILRAMLTGSITHSSVYTTGAILTILSTIYFVCAGHVAYTSGGIILKAANDPYTADSAPDTVCLSSFLILAGVTAEVLCWLSVMTVTAT